MKRTPQIIVHRAQELYQTPVTEAGVARQRTIAETHRALVVEFPDHPITPQNIRHWVKGLPLFGQTAPPVEVPMPAAPPPAGIPLALATLPDEARAAEFDWARRKAVFLEELAGLAEGMIHVVKDILTGDPKFVVRDAESGVKTINALVDTIGRLNSGKYDRPEGEERLRLTEEQLQIVILGFTEPDKYTLPALPRGTAAVIDTEAQPG